MVYLLLTGGLGNQLFQFALYRKLEYDSIDVKLDFSHLDLFQEHNGISISKLFSYNECQIENNCIYKIFKRVKIESSHKVITLILWQIKKISDFLLKRELILEKSHGIYDEFLICRLANSKKDVSLIGYWQSENYFKDIRRKLIEELDFSLLNEVININLLNIIDSTNSVSIHIRRGDYLSKNNKSSHFIFNTMNYYFSAISYINDHCYNPVYFVFSDDPEWVKTNLKLNATYIDWNKGFNNYKDMLLMSRCKNNIIANSSFSWWGAWLNSNDEKIVIAPEIWMNDTETPDIIPCDWIKLPV